MGEVVRVHSVYLYWLNPRLLDEDDRRLAHVESQHGQFSPTGNSSKLSAGDSPSPGFEPLYFSIDTYIIQDYLPCWVT